MREKFQRFGGAMFTPVLLFSFAGVVVGFSILFKNTSVMGALAAETTLWYKFWKIVEEGAWTIFRQLPLLFAIGLPVGLAKKQNARACMESFVTYLTFQYFLSAILTLWGPSFGVDFTMDVGGASGLTTIAGIKTLDTGMLGAIAISGFTVFLHNKYFDTELPEYLGSFRGSSFVVILGFITSIPLAFATALIWPKIQLAILSAQAFLVSSGTLGVGIYTFLERSLIPTGLHHFIYSPFVFDSAIVSGGLKSSWALNLNEIAASTAPLKELFPGGGFQLHGLSKVYGCLGIALAFYFTSKPEKKKQVLSIIIPALLPAVLAGITEPLEFTFLFIAPPLFFIHALLAGLLAATSYSFGLVGDFGAGLIEWFALNWIPNFKNHGGTYLICILIGLTFTAIWFFVFKFLILKFDFKTPGREADDVEARLFTKADYKEKHAADGKKTGGDVHRQKAEDFLTLLGGRGNIDTVTNCATRLRVKLRDEALLQDASAFKVAGAHGVKADGKAVQIIVGLTVPNVRDEFEKLLS